MSTSNLTLVNENGLTEIQLGLAKQIAEKFSTAATLAEGVLVEEVNLKTKYVTLCDELRKTGMNGKELTLLLLFKGHKKTRVSEIKKICSLPQEVFDKYLTGDIGRAMAIKIARTGVQNVDEAQSVAEQEGDAADVAKPVEAPKAVNLIPEKELNAIRTALRKSQMSMGKHVGQLVIGDKQYNLSISVVKPVVM